MKAALYHRVSTADQNPDAARAELRAAAAARGLEVVLDVEETGSGARNDRPGLKRVLEAARRGEISAVVVWKLDRFGRSSLDLHTNVAALVSCGCRFVCTSQGLEVRPDGDAVSSLVMGVLSAVAQFELQLVRERTRLGLARARAAGKRLGRPPVSSLAVRAAQQWVAEGLSLRQVAFRLRRDYGPVSPSGLSQALRRARKGGLAGGP